MVVSMDRLTRPCLALTVGVVGDHRDGRAALLRVESQSFDRKLARRDLHRDLFHMPMV